MKPFPTFSTASSSTSSSLPSFKPTPLPSLASLPQPLKQPLPSFSAPLPLPKFTPPTVTAGLPSFKPLVTSSALISPLPSTSTASDDVLPLPIFTTNSVPTNTILPQHTASQTTPVSNPNSHVSAKTLSPPKSEIQSTLNSISPSRYTERTDSQSISSIAKSWLLSDQQNQAIRILSKAPKFDLNLLADTYSYLHPSPFVNHDIISIASSQYSSGVKEPLQPTFDFSTSTPEEVLANKLKARMVQNISNETTKKSNPKPARSGPVPHNDSISVT